MQSLHREFGIITNVIDMGEDTEHAESSVEKWQEEES